MSVRKKINLSFDADVLLNICRKMNVAVQMIKRVENMEEISIPWPKVVADEFYSTFEYAEMEIIDALVKQLSERETDDLIDGFH